MKDDLRKEIQKLNDTFVRLYNEAKFQEAMPFAQRLFDLAKKHFGKDHPNFVTSLDNLATLCHAMGKYANAEDLYRQALEIRRDHLGLDHLDTAASMDNLAHLYDSMGDYLKAEALCKKALEIRRKRLGRDHPDFASSLNNLARIYDSIGNYVMAEPRYREAMEIRQKVLGEDHPDFAESVNNLAHLYDSMGNYSEAEPLYRQAMEIRRRILGDDHPYYAASLNNLAGFYHSIGNYTKAEPLYRKALAIWQRALGEDNPGFAAILNSLAGLLKSMHRYGEAKPLYQQAMEIRSETLGEDHPSYAISLDNLAGVYQAIKNYTAAEPLYRKAMEIRRKALGENHPDFARSLNNLGGLYHALGFYSEAEPLYRRAIKISREALDNNHPEYAEGLDNLAGLLAALGQAKEAITLMGQALQIQDKMISEIFSFASEFQRFAYLDLRRNDLNCFFSLVWGSLFDSRKAIQSAMSLTLRRKAILAEVLATQRDVILGGRYPHLKPKLNELKVMKMQIARKNLSRPGKERIEEHLRILAEWESQKEQLESELAREIPEMSLKEILVQKTLLSEVQTAQQDTTLQDRCSYLKPKLDELRTMRMQIAQKSLTGPGKEGVEEHPTILAEWISRKKRLELDLAPEIPKMNPREMLRQEEMFREADCPAVAGCLRVISGILVEFVRFEVFDFKAVPSAGDSQWKPSRYLAFVLIEDKPDEVQMIDLGEAEPIDLLIARFRSAVGNKASNERSSNLVPLAVTSTGEPLRKAIFDPLRESLGDHKRIIISPDGDLSRIPFEALPDGRDGFLIDDYQFSYVAVGRDLLRFGRKPFGDPMPSLVAADPDFNLGIMPQKMKGKLGDLPYDRLLATRKEGEAVAKKLGVSPWLDRSVLEKQLKEVRSPKILHIATHGFFHEDQKLDPNEKIPLSRPDYRGAGGPEWLPVSNLRNPLLLSGLALAGANTSHIGEKPPQDAEDGLLTAEDVTGMDLLDTELVVLSACDTGLGEVHIGEGVMGLRRSFMLAGAKTLVMSLWKVPDKETRELMEDFYDRLLNGAPRAEALRQAQLAMKAKYPNPYFWGAFICQGDPSPIKAFKQPV